MLQPLSLIRGARVIDPAAGIDAIVDVLIGPGGVTIDPSSVPDHARRVDGRGQWALPGLVDLQVHLRDPGLTHKEDQLTGSRAALSGGVTTMVVMPNTRPVLDDPALVAAQSSSADARGLARVLVAAAATRASAGQALSDYRALKAAGAVAVTDDGLPVQDDALMEQSLISCAANDLVFMQHAEDTRISQHRPMTECEVQRAAGILGQPAEAEWVMVERDVALAERTGARYHVLHLSTARSLAAVRRAKERGASVTCEVSPHHLTFTCNDVVKAGIELPSTEADLDPNKKMNPPLRSGADRRALVDGLADGTVDAVATDHAPHTAAEKGQGFARAPFGTTGLETMLGVLLRFVHDGTIDARRAVELVTSGPARVLRRQGALGTLSGRQAPPDLCLVDPERSWVVTTGALQSRSKNNCFLGLELRGRVTATWLRGRLAYQLIA
ncbi:MAG: dihydroorotase [Deltaproteobacteria bacterium]|nr:dihydroorotase [Deltaproteobacteria bacterium]